MVTMIIIAAFLTTLVGGLLALSLRDRLHLIVGFSAGTIVAVAFFALLPEAIHLTEDVYDHGLLLALTAVGFFSYLALDRIFLRYGHSDEDVAHNRGNVGATSLSFHSFLDGAGVALAFQASTEVGVLVAAGVLAHRFSDGINTVSIILKNSGSRARAFRWLLVSASAPVLGALSTLLITIQDADLGLLLGLFAGFFLYIGASDLIPESHHAHPVRLTTITTIAGAIVLYLVIALFGGDVH